MRRASVVRTGRGQMPSGLEDTQNPIKRFLKRNLAGAAGLSVIALAAALAASLATWSVDDPSFNHATTEPVRNALGWFGAVFSDIVMQSIGLSAAVFLVPVVLWGWRLLAGKTLRIARKRIVSWGLGTILAAGALAALPLPETWPLPTGLGGFIGDFVHKIPAMFTGNLTSGMATIIGVFGLGLPALYLLVRAAGWISRDPVEVFESEQQTFGIYRGQTDSDFEEEEDDVEDEERPGFFSTAYGAATHWSLMARAFYRRWRAKRTNEVDDPDFWYDEADEEAFANEFSTGYADEQSLAQDDDVNYAGFDSDYEHEAPRAATGSARRVSWRRSIAERLMPAEEDGLEEFYPAHAQDPVEPAQYDAAQYDVGEDERWARQEPYDDAAYADQFDSRDDYDDYDDHRSFAHEAAHEDGGSAEPLSGVDPFGGVVRGTQVSASLGGPRQLISVASAQRPSPAERNFRENDAQNTQETVFEAPPQNGRQERSQPPAPAPTPTPAPAPAPVGRVIPAVTKLKPGKRAVTEAQPSLLGAEERYEFPPLMLLSEPKNNGRRSSVSADALEQNARILEGVLEDFGVRGEIIEVRPGPVVTLYELEPAPGIKSSRVIGLADDIARSMSAISARVAVIPGKNAIGIELPNQTRDTVYLRELLAASDFERSKAKLPLALGKTINGEPVIADLARMPHLLVAGTTGSGKSVSINTMILSLLYRLPPEECRLIMIDPKMLELSIYDGIPHLLTPVVTDPKKAVVALKWTVREMEERYKKMSKMGVRNIDGFNTRVKQALEKGEKFTRTVQTGFDRETGQPIFEEEDLALETLPFIVVIVDEMADLMMVAGKDIEGTIQRLAQMARAAGIHIVMATQRPSVDVITGTIKANFPTRISFQVTSKIDSRTILGEQGAEQLLGMGDMLYMAGGGRIQRVHGPFVSDDEVEEIVAHLKTQGTPQYLEAVTEEDEEAESPYDSPAGGDESNDLYDKAVAIVLRDKKASTSYIQRRLSIGYNRAASIIERMEEEGVVSAANHAGKREILVQNGVEEDY